MSCLRSAALGFALSLAGGLAQLACTEPCVCPPQTATPPEQSLPLADGVRYSPDDVTVERPVDFLAGTLTTEGGSLIIEYETPEGAYVVTYALQE